MASEEKAGTLQTLFSSVVRQASEFLGEPPQENRYQSVRWADIPSTLDNRRFGVSEFLNSASMPELLVSEKLKHSETYILEWVLWREAILEHLCNRVRQVPEAADLGLYGGLKHGLRKHRRRHNLQRIWETISLPQHYACYRYVPTAGFHFFDKVVEGTFLQRVIPWLNTTFSGVDIPLTSESYTAALERWMFDFHQMLSPREQSILTVLNNHPEISQTQLAKRVKLTQPPVSRALKRLASKHLLRFIRYINLPVIGLQRLAVTYTSQDLRVLYKLRKMLSTIRYTLTILELDDAIHCTFAIPTRRVGRFRSWAKELSTAWDLPYPEIRTVLEQAQHRNFTIYDPERGGWPQDYEPILENISRLVREELSSLLPPIRTIKYPQSNPPQKLKLKPADFVYIQRATKPLFQTDRIESSESQEARLAGYRESEHLTYRRRIRILKKAGLLSPPMGIGLIHVGLTATINLLVEGTYEQSFQLLSAFQLMPHMAGVIYRDGCAAAVLLVPKDAAVAIETSLRDILLEIGFNTRLMVKPTWEAYGATIPSPVDSKNYDFDRGAWVWAKDTLPGIHPLAL
ncbi:MAG: winged helix-turn-helix transcriptional regulator [Promethearchaeota archaeon]